MLPRLGLEGSGELSGDPSNHQPFPRLSTKDHNFASMRLPHQFLDSQFFLFASCDEFFKALGEIVSVEERAEITRLSAIGLPPVTSRTALGTMLGVNPGIIWSFINRPHRYYRSFEIRTGQKIRRIDAPRVALKIIQKWLSVQLDKTFRPPDHVYGFTSGRSHIAAAKIHVASNWIFSVDISSFFQTTPIDLVKENIIALGFNDHAADLIANLSCLNNFLAQGSPLSPVLSNICFAERDNLLHNLADEYGVRLTRYADDIVFSGKDAFPNELKEKVLEMFSEGTWRLAEHKTQLSALPNRLKVHGLLVHGETIRLTKGYRNKLRAYKHLSETNQINEKDLSKIRGHLMYGEFVEKTSIE